MESPAIAQPRDRSPGKSPKEETSDTASRRGSRGLEPLGKALRPLVKPLLKKRSPLEAALLLDWEQAVGPELAKLCQPLKLRRERRADSQVGSLELACLSWAALELQHRTPQIIERVNGFLGVQAIQRLRIRQVPRLTTRHASSSASLQGADQGKKAQPDGPSVALPSSGHGELDRALARLAGTLTSRKDHEDAT